MTLAVIRPLVSTYNSTGVPSGVFPKSILATLPWLLGSPPAQAPAAPAGDPRIPSKTATRPIHVVSFRIDHFPGSIPRAQEPQLPADRGERRSGRRDRV